MTCCGMGSLWVGPRASGNNTALLSDNQQPHRVPLLYITVEKRMFPLMKHISLPLVTALLIALGSPAFAADCYADYKAKQDNPLRLHYGVAKVTGPCSKASAKKQLAQRLGAQNWKLLNVVSVFGPEGLEKRKNSAGSNFLRF